MASTVLFTQRAYRALGVSGAIATHFDRSFRDRTLAGDTAPIWDLLGEIGCKPVEVVDPKTGQTRLAVKKWETLERLAEIARQGLPCPMGKDGKPAAKSIVMEFACAIPLLCWSAIEALESGSAAGLDTFAARLDLALAEMKAKESAEKKLEQARAKVRALEEKNSKPVVVVPATAAEPATAEVAATAAAEPAATAEVAAANQVVDLNGLDQQIDAAISILKDAAAAGLLSEAQCSSIRLLLKTQARATAKA